MIINMEISIFSPKKGIPHFSANRMRRWVWILSNYRYSIKYVNLDKNLADGLSRLPVQKYDLSMLDFYSELN